MKILEEFWYGNIKPMEYDTSFLQGVRESTRTDLQGRRKTPGRHNR